jgi:hypothetical protein
MADESRRKLTLVALQHSAGRLRSLIAQRLTMRTVPWLTFHLDDSIRRSFETVQTIDRLMQELTPASDGASADPASQDPGDVTAVSQPARRDAARGSDDELPGREDS